MNCINVSKYTYSKNRRCLFKQKKKTIKSKTYISRRKRPKCPIYPQLLHIYCGKNKLIWDKLPITSLKRKSVITWHKHWGAWEIQLLNEETFVFVSSLSWTGCSISQVYVLMNFLDYVTQEYKSKKPKKCIMYKKTKYKLYPGQTTYKKRLFILRKIR